MSALLQSWSRSGLLRSRTAGPSLVPRLVSVQRVDSSSSVSAQVQDQTGTKTRLKTIKDLPKVGFPKLLYRLIVKGFYNRMHELQLYEKNLYGPVYRDGLRTVALASAELLEEVLRRDEKFPVRGDMSLWKEYRDTQGIGYGPFTEEGQRWYGLRSVLNRKMLLPKESLQFGPVIRDVVRDFTDRVQVLRKSSPSGTWWRTSPTSSTLLSGGRERERREVKKSKREDRDREERIKREEKKEISKRGEKRERKMRGEKRERRGRREKRVREEESERKEEKEKKKSRREEKEREREREREEDGRKRESREKKEGKEREKKRERREKERERKREREVRKKSEQGRGERVKERERERESERAGEKESQGRARERREKRKRKGESGEKREWKRERRK
ncbi:hypothetical protein WMY93_031406 [Mugilogobius chulae]|uniref:Uncharacterized protein n=1 Tax=Mugilogobius chulae TaxID=88201 RepID=A0AAW0MFP1_9GOBI